MKRMIITPAQLKAINEASVLTNAKSSSPADIMAAVNGVMGKTNSNTVQVGIPGNNGVAQATSFPALKTGDTIDPNASSVSVTVDPTKTGVTESRRYSKRQVELGRMLEMRRTGKVFSKKQLNEMFMEDGDFGLGEDNIAEKIGELPAFNVMTCVRTAFGEDVFNHMVDVYSSGENPTEFIVKTYNEASDEEKRIFKERLGIE